MAHWTSDASAPRSARNRRPKSKQFARVMWYEPCVSLVIMSRAVRAACFAFQKVQMWWLQMRGQHHCRVRQRGRPNLVSQACFDRSQQYRQSSVHLQPVLHAPMPIDLPYRFGLLRPFLLFDFEEAVEILQRHSEVSQRVERYWVWDIQHASSRIWSGSSSCSW